MSDYYHQFLSSMTGAGDLPTPTSTDASPSTQQPPAIALEPQGISSHYQNLGYFTGFPEPIMFNSSKSQRSRRKSAPGPDHIKHRRTRSGCYTCRSRRVKCDETHPICERCRKGKRECIYPEPLASRGPASQGFKDGATHSQQTSPASSHDDDEDDTEHDRKLEPIIDEDVDESQGESGGPPSSSSTSLPRKSSATPSLALQRVKPFNRQDSETPSQEGSKSSSPLVATGAATFLTPSVLQTIDFPSWTTSAGAMRSGWSFLPQELQFYLNYFCDNITHFHYCIFNDSHDFFRSILPAIAVRDEALLYAVVGFSAYHHTVQTSCGQLKGFLQYYNRSVTLLLSFLRKKEKYNVATLLTILQLATIEEFLGDWANLMNHQKAAFEVLTQLFTPSTILQSPAGCMMLQWYSRFDMVTSLMGGFGASLSTEWYLAEIEYWDTQVAADPANVSYKFDARASRLRRIALDITILYDKKTKSELTEDEYAAEHQRLSKQLQDWKSEWDPALTDPAYRVNAFSSERSPPPDDIVDPFAPGILYNPPLFASTILTCDWHAAVAMLEKQGVTTSVKEEPLPSIAFHAYAICQIVEAIELWPNAPNGCLIAIRSNLAAAALFVPRDVRHHMWIRRKFALLERTGYICPMVMRIRMAELFGDQTCVDWWLPNEEGLTPLLKSIRSFADERTAAAGSAQAEHVVSMRIYFANMRLGGLPEHPGTDDSLGTQSKGKGKDTGA